MSAIIDLKPELLIDQSRIGNPYRRLLLAALRGRGRGYATVDPLSVERCPPCRGASNFRKPEHWN